MGCRAGRNPVSLASSFSQVALLQIVEADYPPCNRACGNGIWAGKPHLSWSRSAEKLRLMALIVTCSRVLRGPRSAIGAGTARRLQHFGADRCERVEIPFLDAIVAHVDRAELQIELYTYRDFKAAPRGPAQDFVVVVEVVALARGTGAAVRDVDRGQCVRANRG